MKDFVRGLLLLGCVMGCATTRAAPVATPTAPRVALTGAALDAAFAAHRAELDACHAAAQVRLVIAGGDVTLRLTVGDDGRVTEVVVTRSTHTDTVVPVCLANAARGFTFPPPTPGDRTAEATLHFDRGEPPMPADVDGYLTAQMALRQSQFAAGMEPVMPAARGALETSQTQNYAVPLEAGFCYKIIGVAPPSATDLDLKLFDASNTQVDADVATDNFPVIGLQRPLCPTRDETYRLEVVMYAGRGPYLVQAFGIRGGPPMSRLPR